MNIEIKTNDKRLLVDGEFTTDSVVHSIRLSCSGSLITGRPQTVVTGAQISITDQVETFYYIENKESAGLYQTQGKCCGKGGHNYTLMITNIDIDNDGKYETYVAQTMMPAPVRFDSMASRYGMNGDRIEGTVVNIGYYTVFHNGPDYLYNFVILNTDSLATLRGRLGSGDLTRNELGYKVKKVDTLGSIAHGSAYYFITPRQKVSKGDTICLVGLNFAKNQYEFLRELDKNTSSGSVFEDNLFDQLRMPANLPTNIEPSDKAAGYFFIYSISKISKVFN